MIATTFWKPDAAFKRKSPDSEAKSFKGSGFTLGSGVEFRVQGHDSQPRKQHNQAQEYSVGTEGMRHLTFPYMGVYETEGTLQ